MWMAMVATVCRRMALPLIALLTLLPLSARALREGEGGTVTSVLYRRGCGRSQGHGGGLREALSWHLGHWQRRLQQRAGLRDRPAAQRQEGHHRLLAVSDHPRLSPVGQGGSADAFQT